MSLPRRLALAALAVAVALLAAVTALLAARSVPGRWPDAGLVGAATLVTTGAVAALFGVAEHRRAARERRLAELGALLCHAADETDARELLLGHARRVVPHAGAAVLTRVESEERLEATLGQRIAGTPLRGLLVGRARSDACLAVRLAHPQVRGPGESPLAGCELCGRLAGESVCEPLSAGGRVLGSLLVASVDPIAPAARAELQAAVARTAPLIALARTTADGSRRAARDPLTGLANRRSEADALARLCAQAGRTLTPLAAILIDLDHLGDVNDRFGHARGDGAIAAVATAIGDGVRASDFVSRHGGQSLLVLGPDTARIGAVALAEKLRHDVERLAVPGVGRVTASFGVASLPEDAADGDGLVRLAERALGMAKALGRNCVATPEPSPASGA